MPKLNLEWQGYLTRIERGVLESQHSMWKEQMDRGVKDHGTFWEVQIVRDGVTRILGEGAAAVMLEK